MWPTDFRLGDFVVQPATDRLTRGDLRVELEPKTMAVLLALAARPGDVVSSDELIRDIWHDRAMGDNPVYKSVAKLRRALDDEADEPRYIETIPRKGYRLLVKPQSLAAPQPDSFPRWRLASLGFGAAVALLLIAGSYWAFRSDAGPEMNSAASGVVPQVYFPGLESDVPEVVAINKVIRDRLGHIPGLAISERPVDAPLATFRLSGLARADGSRLRVHLQLDGERGSDLWSSDLSLQADESYRVAEQVAAAVQEAASISRSDKLPASLPFATLQAYLQARTELRERRPGFRQRLMDASADVVRAEPGFAPGQAIRADACLFAATFGSETEKPHNLQCARDAVARALAIDPELAEAHAAAGLLALAEAHNCFDGCPGSQWHAAAQRDLERAVRLDPTLLEARVWLGNTYDEMGDLTRAAEQREAAVALDPLSPVANLHMNNVLLARGERDLVRNRLLRMAQVPGMPPYLYEQLAEVFIADRRFAEARVWARHVSADTDDERSQLVAATLLARCGQLAEARALYGRVSWNPPLDDEDKIYYAVKLHQAMGGSAAVRDFIEGQLDRALAGETPGPATDHRLGQAIGWALVMSDQPTRARPWLEDSVGKIDVQHNGIYTFQSTVEVLEALAWVTEQGGDPARASEFAQSALEQLSVVATAGMDQDVGYALSHALALALAGQREPALAELDRAIRLGWSEPVFIRADPRWANLLRDPAAQTLLARVDRSAMPARVAAAVTR